MSKRARKQPPQEFAATSAAEAAALGRLHKAEDRLHQEQKARKAAEARIKHLKMLLDEQQEQLETIKKSKYEVPQATAKQPHKDSYLRLIVPDTHGCFAEDEAIALMLADMETIPIREVVLIGDHLDAAGWMAKHHPFKTVQEARYSFFEDVDRANLHLDEIQKRAPAAKVHYLEGNHEERIEAWCVESAAGQPHDAERLHELFSPQSLMHLGKRKVAYYRRTDRHGNLRRRGVIKLGQCYFLHGMTHGKTAADKHLDYVGRNVVFGHVHQILSASTADVMTGFASWCFGCLCRLEPIWAHSKPTNWNHGYGIQCVQPDGSFLTIAVPIVEGRSYLSVLLKTAGI